MQNEKIFILCTLVIGVVSLVGCSELALTNEDMDDIKAVFIKEKDVKKLDGELTKIAMDQFKATFAKDTSTKEYSLHFAEMIDEDSFKGISSSNTSNDIYLYGSAKNQPKDVVDFTMIYDNDKKEVKDLFMTTLNVSNQLSMH